MVRLRAETSISSVCDKVFLTFIDMFDHLNIGKNSEQQCATIVWVLLWNTYSKSYMAFQFTF